MNIANPDSFLNHISDLQSKQGLPQAAHIPTSLENRLYLSGNIDLSLELLRHLFMTILFLVSVVRVKQFYKTMQKGISSSCRSE